MALPVPIGDAAQDADADRVKAWLDGGGDVNDVDKDGYTLLHCCAVGSRDDNALMEIGHAHVSLARTLIALGADVNIPETAGPQGSGTTPLHNASRGQGVASLDRYGRAVVGCKGKPECKMFRRRHPAQKSDRGNG